MCFISKLMDSKARHPNRKIHKSKVVNHARVITRGPSVFSSKKTEGGNLDQLNVLVSFSSSIYLSEYRRYKGTRHYIKLQVIISKNIAWCKGTIAPKLFYFPGRQFEEGIGTSSGRKGPIARGT